MPNVKFSNFSLGVYDVSNFIVGYDPTLNTNIRIPIAAFNQQITLTTSGNSGSATLVGGTLNVPTYTLSGLGGVPTSRTLTINGITQDLSANRTFTISAISSLNGLTNSSQTFATGTSGTDFAISSAGSTHTFNLPTASALNRGALSSADWTTFNSKQNQITLTTTGNSGSSTLVGSTLNVPTYTLAGLGGISLTSLSAASPLQYNNTTGQFSIPAATSLANGYLTSTDWNTFNSKQNTITLTTTGSSGASTLVGSTLNIPNYTLSGLGGVPSTRTLTINGTALDLSADRSWSVGTVTSVSALTLGTTGTDLNSSVATGSTTPVITLNVPTASATNRGALSSADWTTFNSKQSPIALTTTGSAGPSTFIGSTLNVPNYTLSGLGGVPTTRTLTINGVSYDLSVDRSWTVTTSGQTLNDVTLLGNTSDQDIIAQNGALFQTEDTTALDYFECYPNAGTATFRYSGSGADYLILQADRMIWGSSLLNQIQFRTSNLSAGIVLEMPNTLGSPTIPVSVNGVLAGTNGDISIAVGGTQTLQQTTTLGNTTTDDIILVESSLVGVETIDFDLTPTLTAHSEGRVRWNDFDKSIQVDTENSNVSVSVGHDLIQRVNNQTGVTITKGKVVYINGQQGGRPTIALADNTSDPTSANTFGIVMDDINNNNNGYVITNGLLSGINTSTYTAGQVLYLSTSGNITGTKPVAPANSVSVAIVISVGILGSVYVSVQNGYELEELHDVLITTPLDKQVLTYDSTSSLWKNEYPSRYYNLGFNNIASYTVNGGSGTQNLGAGTLGMSLFSPLSETLYITSGSNYVYNVTIITCEEFGGVACDIGLRVTYSSSAGSSTFDSLGAASRTAEFGSNYAVQRRAASFNVPILTSGAPTNLIKFEVLMQRNTAGSTSVYLSQLIFAQ